MSACFRGIGVGVIVGTIGMLFLGFSAVLLAASISSGVCVGFFYWSQKKPAILLKTEKIPKRIRQLVEEKNTKRKTGIVKHSWKYEVGTWYSESSEHFSYEETKKENIDKIRCPQCGKEVKNNAKFCSHCGWKLKDR